MVVLASMEVVGWLRHSASSTRWEVNPQVHDLFAKQAQAERQARDETKRQISANVARLRGPAHVPQFVANVSCARWT
jgi:hypothetical protein